MKTKRNNLLILLAVMLLITACKTTKTVVQREIPHGLPASDMVVSLQNEQPAFTTANVSKMSIAVDLKNRQMTVAASCAMVTDSAIHLSIQPFFGIELFKLEMTPKNIIVIDKTNRKFYESAYSFFKNRFGVNVDFDAIQSLISNRLFVVGNRAYLPGDFKWKNDNSQTNTLEIQTDKMKQEIVVEAALHRIAQMILQTPDNGYKMTTVYSDFKTLDSRMFPANILIKADNTNSKASFEFTIERVKFDEPLTLRAANLDRYTRGDINSFLSK